MSRLNGMYPTWSSDASQIAFMSWRNGRTELFTAKAGGDRPADARVDADRRRDRSAMVA